MTALGRQRTLDSLNSQRFECPLLVKADVGLNLAWRAAYDPLRIFQSPFLRLTLV